jgi:hypothetical protein
MKNNTFDGVVAQAIDVTTFNGAGYCLTLTNNAV